MRTKTVISAVIASMAAASPALAHTAFMKPSAFDVTRGDYVTVQSSFTDDFSYPEVGVKSQDWHYYAPDGTRHAYENVVELRQITLLEGKLAGEGTYRFTSGERLGRTGQMILAADGTLKPARNEDGEEISPLEGETLVTSQTATVSDVYVSKGAPTMDVVGLPVGRLQFKPLSHPNEWYADEMIQIEISFDGQPLAGQGMELVREGGAYLEGQKETEIVTDADGIAEMILAPGIYLLMTRHRAESPEGAESDYRGYTTSLTFEVTK